MIFEITDNVLEIACLKRLNITIKRLENIRIFQFRSFYVALNFVVSRIFQNLYRILFFITLECFGILALCSETYFTQFYICIYVI